MTLQKAIKMFAPLNESTGWTILPEMIEGTRRGYRVLPSHDRYKGNDSIGTITIQHVGQRQDIGIPAAATIRARRQTTTDKPDDHP